MEEMKIKTLEGWKPLQEVWGNLSEEEKRLIMCYIENYDYNKCQQCRNVWKCASLPVVPLYYPSI